MPNCASVFRLHRLSALSCICRWACLFAEYFTPQSVGHDASSAPVPLAPSPRSYSCCRICLLLCSVLAPTWRLARRLALYGLKGEVGRTCFYLYFLRAAVLLHAISHRTCLCQIRHSFLMSDSAQAPPKGDMTAEPMRSCYSAQPRNLKTTK